MDCYAVPEISEQGVLGPLKALYEDIKYTLKVPVVNFMFRTLALYEKFLLIGWNEVKPNMLTKKMEEAGSLLRYPGISAEVPQINWQYYYDMDQIDIIRRIILTFNYVNPKLLLIASAWAESLSERPLEEKTGGEETISPGILPELPEINLIEYDEAPLNIRGLYEDIAKTHSTIDIASDFRALANYPSFLIESWKYLRPFVKSEEYHTLASGIKKLSVDLVHTMPFPVAIARKNLRQIYNPKDIAGIMGTVSMFQNLLPGLIVDGEFLRRIIE